MRRRTGPVRDVLAVMFLAITMAVVAGIIGGLQTAAETGQCTLPVLWEPF